MDLDRKQLKWDARAVMRECRPRPMLVTLVYLLLTGGLALVVNGVTVSPLAQYQQYILAGYSPDIALYYAFAGSGGMGIALFLSILLGLFTMVMNFGYCAWALRCSRGEQTGYGTLLTGFSMAGRVIGLNLFVGLFAFLWALAVMIPPVILISVVVALTMNSGMTGLFVVLAVIIYIAAIVLLVMILLRYALAEYALLDDPEAGIRAAVNRSKALMSGRKGSYFVLQLSFIGWYLLVFLLEFVGLVIAAAVIGAAGWSWNAGMIWGLIGVAAGSTLGTVLIFLLPLVLNLWLTPYVQITTANFYDAVSKRTDSEPAESFPVL